MTSLQPVPKQQSRNPENCEFRETHEKDLTPEKFEKAGPLPFSWNAVYTA